MPPGGLSILYRKAIIICGYTQLQTLSIVVPAFNEEDAVLVFLDRVVPVLEKLSLLFEIIFVDDGSKDRTVDVVSSARDHYPMVRLVVLSRNFGKEAALTAGLDAAVGDAVIPMDIDLQDPPELISEFVALWRAGYDVVYGQRMSRDSDTLLKKTSASMFYRLFNSLSSVKMEQNVGDFRLMNRPALEATLKLRERNRFMKGIFAWVGFRAVGVPYARPPRVAGQTKFNYWKLWNFALDGVTGFSTVPLRVWSYIGLIVAVSAIIYTVVIVAKTTLFGTHVPGYASLMVVILLLGAVQLLSLGIMGEYVGRLYIEVKERPIYLVRERVGFLPLDEEGVNNNDAD